MRKYDVTRKSGSTQRSALSSEEKGATATGNMYNTIVKFGRVIFEICEQTYRQTDRRADTLITILRTFTWSEVK